MTEWKSRTEKQALHPRRILIFGNSGAGKSTLAARLASETGAAHLDLDTLAWQPTDPPERVPVEQARGEILHFTGSHEGWVIEGCYADLLELLLTESTELIFLDLTVADCQANARNRPWEPHKYPSPEAQDANLEMLLAWIAAYPDREGDLGRKAHERLFNRFKGEKQRVTSRQNGQ